MTRAREEKGAVLLVVLVIIVLLSAALSQLAFSTLVDMRLTETFRDNTRGWYLAKGGVQAGRMILQLDQKTNAYDSQQDFWYIGIPNYPVGDTGAVSVRITDLESKLNVNDLVVQGGNPNPDMLLALRNLFTTLQQDHPDAFPNAPDDMVAALMDWIDNDNAVTQQNGTGAEDPFYETLQPPYVSKDAALDTFQEIGKVKGFTPEALRLLDPFLTAYPPAGNGNSYLNINTAPFEVLAAMDPAIDPVEFESLKSFREKDPIKNANDVKQVVGDQSPLYMLLSKQWVKTRFSSNHFLISSTGMIGDSLRNRTVSAVVDHSGQNVFYMKVD